MKTCLFILTMLCLQTGSNAQQTSTPGAPSPLLAKAFEMPDPADEIVRLEGKRDGLLVRLNALKSDPASSAEEIARVESLIQYIDHKIERLQKYLDSVAYAEKTNAPVQGDLSDEAYKAKKLEWQKTQQNDPNADSQIKTTLTRAEFERLPKERQERILSMPERYTILD